MLEARSLPLRAVGLLRRPLRFLPYRLQRAFLEPLLNHLFREPLVEGELDFLAGKPLRIDIRDLGLCWQLDARDGRLALVDAGDPAAVRVSGNVLEFLLLASREEDPDTLFFQRRLVIEGETAIGLQLKNLLDRMEFEDLPLPLRHLLKVVLEVEKRLRAAD